MSRSRLNVALFTPLVLVALACSESPTAPPQRMTPDVSERTILAPFILPRGADWGHYFVSFNRDQSLDVDVIHYADPNPNGRMTGRGAFAIPRVGVGVLYVLGGSADPAQGCTPENRVCDGTTGPESSYSYGFAAVKGRRGSFTLHLESNYWPNPKNTYDTATLTLCLTTCNDYVFFGELHHEP
jgi:hypothetical protein